MFTRIALRVSTTTQELRDRGGMGAPVAEFGVVVGMVAVASIVLVTAGAGVLGRAFGAFGSHLGWVGP